MPLRETFPGTTLYRLTFSNLDSQTSEKTLIDYTANLLFLHHEELTGLDQRVQDGKILESELFFLTPYKYEKDLNELNLDEMTKKVVINDLLYNVFATKLGLTEFKRSSILNTYLNKDRLT